MRQSQPMKITTRAAVFALIFFARCPATAWAGHPLLTEDTATQGAGRYQLEMTHDLSTRQDADARTRFWRINGILSVGLTDALDVIATLPHERLSVRTGATNTTVAGYADMEIAAKWRFYDAGSLSFALRPGLGLPTGNEGKGLGAGHVMPSLFAVTSYADAPWAFHLHVGHTHHPHSGPEGRSHIYHASVAAEYNVSKGLRLVSDVSIERNAERSGHPGVGSMVIGLVVSLTPDLDLDLGYRKGLTEPAPDQAWLTGLAVRF